MTKNAGETLFEFGSRPVSINVLIEERYANLIADLLTGWSVTISGDRAVDPHFQLITGSDGKVYVSGHWVGAGYRIRDKADIACSFIAEALKTQANENTDQYCVHAASAVFAGQAVIFAGGFRSGKSTLTAVLAARGLPIVGDDAIFISPLRQSAISPGISPRLRLPLPDTLAERTQQFVRKTSGLTGERYSYLTLPGERQMANGEEVPIGAFVFVNRANGADTRIVDIPKSEALKLLIWQNFARQAPADQILASLSKLVQTRKTVELRYDDVEDAADLLIDTFKDWQIASPRRDTIKPVNLDQLRKAGNPEWRVNPEIEEERLDDGHFIADTNTGRIFYLNAIGAAIWRMLSAGHGGDEIMVALAEAFPETEARRIGSDVDTLISTFQENGLLLVKE